MTAAKIMDIISIIARLRWTGSRRSISLYPSENGRCSQIIEKSKIGSVQTFGFVYHDTNGLNQWSSMKDPVVPLERNLYGYPLAGLLWERQFEKIPLKHGWEKIPNWECLFVHREKDYSYLCRTWFGRTNIFPGSCILGMYSTTMPNKQRCCGQLQNHVRIANFRRRSRETTIPSKYSYFFMVFWYGGSCKEMCGAILWVIQQVYTTTLQSIYSMHRWPSFQRRRNKIRGRIVKSMLPNCSEMLILGTYWKTWYSMVSEQTCTIDHKLDQNMWQTIMLFDLQHSSYMWIQTVLSCGKHCQTMQIGTVSRLWLRGRSWRFEIHFWRNTVHFRKVIHLFNKLDVQETNCCFAQFKQNLKSSLWTLDWD